MSKKAFTAILISILVFLPVACSFKKDSGDPKSNIAKIKPFKASAPNKFKEQPDLFKVIANENLSDSIDALDAYTM